MERPELLGMVGTTLQRVGQSALAPYMPVQSSLAPEAWLHQLSQACGFREMVYLATCNRMEVIFACSAAADDFAAVAHCRQRLFQFFQPTCAPADLPRQASLALHAYAGEGAAEHLFEVATSLDSVNPGEAQILGQVKAAYKCSQNAALLGAQLHIAFEEAFQVAKRVRHATALGSGTISMLSLAKGVIETYLRGSGTPSSAPPNLAIVGVSDMAHQCGVLFGQQAVQPTALLFVNRTLARAQQLAQLYGGRAIALADFLAAPPSLRALVSATRAPAPFLDEAFFAKLAQQPHPACVIDLAVQRDASPQAALAHGIDLYDLDRLSQLSAQARAGRRAEISKARLLVEDALLAYRRRLADKHVAPLVRQLRTALASTLQQEAAELAKSLLQTPASAVVPASAATIIDAWAQSLAARLAHLPTVGLKKLAFAHGMAAVHTLLEAPTPANFTDSPPNAATRAPRD